MIYDSICQLIGKTPLLRLHITEEKAAEVIAKVESFNPGGSSKDRPALYMLEQAERRGDIGPGAVIIEPTSGNTGVGLAMVGAVKGYQVILTMPENMSKERQDLLKAYGAQIVLTPASEGMAGAIAKAEELLRNTPGSFCCGQFDNHDNAQAHYLTTAEEIWADTEGQVDIVVASIGTGGTITGIGRRLKEYNPNIQIIGVEPLQSAVLNGRPKGVHKIQGIGAGFVPQVLDRDILDDVLMVDETDALAMGRLLAKTEGLLVGISSGAAAAGALRLARRAENRGKRIVVILPDTGERYLSTELFNS